MLSSNRFLHPPVSPLSAAPATGPFTTSDL